MSKQSTRERIARLKQHSCPIHGIGMGQVGVNRQNGNYIVECCRQDCFIQAEDNGTGSPLILLPGFQHLINKTNPAQ